MDHPAAMHAPGSERSRTDEMTEPTFTMTASHLARTMEGARARVRAQIARLLRDRRDVILGRGDVEMAAEIDTLILEVEGMAPRAAVAAPIAVDPVEKLWKDEEQKPRVAVDDRRVEINDDGGGLPPVRHMDDFEEGTAMVRNLGARGRGVLGIRD